MSFLDYSNYHDDYNIDNYYKLDTMSKNGQCKSCVSFGGSYPMEITTNPHQLNEQKNMYMLSNGNDWMRTFEANMRQNTIIRNVENGNPNNPNHNTEPNIIVKFIKRISDYFS